MGAVGSTISTYDVAFIVGIIIHFFTFVGIFVRLENRLTKLEVYLSVLLKKENITSDK